MIWRPIYHSRIAQFVDFFTACSGIVTAYLGMDVLHFHYDVQFFQNFKFEPIYFPLILLVSYSYVLFFNLFKAYSYQRFTSIIKEYYIIFKVSILGILVIITTIFMFGIKDIPRTYLVLLFFSITILFLLEKSLLFIIAGFVRKNGKDRKRILVIGAGDEAQKIIETINQHFKWGLDIIGILTENKSEVGTEKHGFIIIDTINNLENVLKIYNPQEVLIALSTKYFYQINHTIEVCGREGLVVRLNSDFFGRIAKNVRIDNIYDQNIVTIESFHYSEFSLVIKRLMDVVISVIAIVLLSPIMLVTGLLILIVDGTPILYEWNVVGLDKIPFKSWKFRTMVKDADAIKESLRDLNEMDGPVFKVKNDPRILPIGRYLRKYSLDELPQLFSVIKGDMSLVGPRPAGPNELVRYQSWHRRKLSIKPGITCLWQVNGRNEISSFDNWVKLDLSYIDNWSILLDIQILLKTIPAVFRGKGAS